MKAVSPRRRAVPTSSLVLLLACSLNLAACGSSVDHSTGGRGSDTPQTGILADIVIPDTNDSLLPGANGVDLSTSLAVSEVTTFFEGQMPSKGWTLAAPVVPKPDSAVLYFEQGARKATVHIRRPPGRDMTLVQVILS